jgi:PAS domain S-box-containing protein
MKIHLKLVLVMSVIIAVLMGFVGVVQINSSRQVAQDINQVDELFELMVAHDIEKLDAVSHIIGALNHTSIAVHKLLLNEEGAREELQASIFEFDQFRGELEDSLRAAADIDQDLRDLADIEKDHEHLHGDVEQLIIFIEANDTTSTAMLFAEIELELELLHDKIEIFEEDAEREIAEIVKKVDGLIHEANAAAAAGRILAVWVIVAVLLALGMGVFVSRAVSRPLNELIHTAVKIIAGDYSVRAKVRGKDEIGQLAEAFNALTESLLEAQNLPKNILRSIKDSLFVVDTRGNITEVNQTGLDVLGYTKEELLGKPISKVFGKAVKASQSDVKGQGSKVIRYVPAEEHEDEDTPDEGDVIAGEQVDTVA